MLIRRRNSDSMGSLSFFYGSITMEDGGEFGPDDVSYAFLTFGTVGVGGVAGGGSSVAVVAVGHLQ